MFPINLLVKEPLRGFVHRFLILLFLLPSHTFGQSSYKPAKEELAKGYARAISEYIKAVYKRDKSRFDTLYFGKHDDFPDIKIPATIENTGIVQLTAAEADIKRELQPSLVFINMTGVIKVEKSEFILVTFYPRYRHQYDCLIDFRYNPDRKEFELENVHFKNYAYK